MTTSNSKKALVIATLLYTVLLLILFFIRFWPPANAVALLENGGGGGGISINFGDSDVGSGNDLQSEVLEVQQQAKPTSSQEAVAEPEILTQENTTNESVSLPQPQKNSKPTPNITEPKPAIVAKPKVNNATNDALQSIINGANKGGDGDDKAAGNKGKSYGSLDAKGYSGSGGSGGGSGGGNGTGVGNGTGSGYGAGTGGGNGGGSGYSLNGRKALSKPAPKYTCNEAGKVVVAVTVDQNGKTIAALAGIKGSTNTAKCLLEQAQIAALNTKWDSNPEAPEKQVGKIVYTFSQN